MERQGAETRVVEVNRGCLTAFFDCSSEAETYLVVKVNEEVEAILQVVLLVLVISRPGYSDDELEAEIQVSVNFLFHPSYPYFSSRF